MSDEKEVSRKAHRLDLSEMLLDYDDGLAYNTNVKKKGLSILKKMGFSPAPQPLRNGKPFMPQLPENPSELDNKEVTDTQAAFVISLSYAKEMRALADAMSEAYEEEGKRVRDTIFLRATGTQKEKESKARTNPKYVELNEKRQEWGFVAKMLSAKHEGYDAARGVCSRDVNFRISEFDAYKRQQNVSGMRRNASFRDPDDWGGDK